jgi:hypothetical protein
VVCVSSAGMANGRRQDRGRKGRYLTVSLLHLVTIMCQGTLLRRTHTAFDIAETSLLILFGGSNSFLL